MCGSWRSRENTPNRGRGSLDMRNGVCYNLIRFDGDTTPGRPELSPSRVWQCREGEPSGVSAGRGSSSPGIIASALHGFHRVKSLSRLSCITTKMPDLPERERPKCLSHGPLGFLFLALGLPAMKYGAALSMRLSMGGGGACDSGFCFLSEASLGIKVLRLLHERAARQYKNWREQKSL